MLKLVCVFKLRTRSPAEEKEADSVLSVSVVVDNDVFTPEDAFMYIVSAWFTTAACASDRLLSYPNVCLSIQAMTALPPLVVSEEDSIERDAEIFAADACTAVTLL